MKSKQKLFTLLMMLGFSAIWSAAPESKAVHNRPLEGIKKDAEPSIMQQIQDRAYRFKELVEGCGYKITVTLGILMAPKMLRFVQHISRRIRAAIEEAAREAREEAAREAEAVARRRRMEGLAAQRQAEYAAEQAAEREREGRLEQQRQERVEQENKKRDEKRNREAQKNREFQEDLARALQDKDAGRVYAALSFFGFNVAKWVNSSLREIRENSGVDGYENQDDKDSMDCYSLLHSAVLRGDLALVQCTLALGADINLRFKKPLSKVDRDDGDAGSMYGDSPLLVALKSKQWRVAYFLLLHPEIKCGQGIDNSEFQKEIFDMYLDEDDKKDIDNWAAMIASPTVAESLRALLVRGLEEKNKSFVKIALERGVDLVTPLENGAKILDQFSVDYEALKILYELVGDTIINNIYYSAESNLDYLYRKRALRIYFQIQMAQKDFVASVDEPLIVLPLSREVNDADKEREGIDVSEESERLLEVLTRMQPQEQYVLVQRWRKSVFDYYQRFLDRHSHARKDRGEDVGDDFMMRFLALETKYKIKLCPRTARSKTVEFDRTVKSDLVGYSKGLFGLMYDYGISASYLEFFDDGDYKDVEEKMAAEG